MAFVFATDLSYVRFQLGRLDPAGLKEVAAKHDVHPKTLRRFVSKATMLRSDTMSRLALYFRTIERRQKRAA